MARCRRVRSHCIMSTLGHPLHVTLQVDVPSRPRSKRIFWQIRMAHHHTLVAIMQVMKKRGWSTVSRKLVWQIVSSATYFFACTHITKMDPRRDRHVIRSTIKHANDSTFFSVATFNHHSDDTTVVDSSRSVRSSIHCQGRGRGLAETGSAHCYAIVFVVRFVLLNRVQVEKALTPYPR